MLILKAIKQDLSYFGGGGASDTAVSAIAGGGTAAAGYATGGPVREGVPVVVGENARELFIPPSNGNIVPNSRLGGRERPVEVHTAVVFREEDVASVIGTAHGERHVLNVIQRNKGAIPAIVNG